jgi:hypothetical protein
MEKFADRPWPRPWFNPADWRSAMRYPPSDNVSFEKAQANFHFGPEPSRFWQSRHHGAARERDLLRRSRSTLGNIHSALLKLR